MPQNDITNINSLAENAVQVDKNLKIAQDFANANKINYTPNILGSFLSVFVASKKAKNIIELGNDGAVSSIWLLDSITKNGTLTSISSNDNILASAKNLIEQTNKNSNKIRFILGDGKILLNKFADNTYDLIYVNESEELNSTLIENIFRILNDSGVLIIRNIFSKNNYKEITEIISNISLLEDDLSYQASILPIEDGILLITKEFNFS